MNHSDDDMYQDDIRLPTEETKQAMRDADTRNTIKGIPEMNNVLEWELYAGSVTRVRVDGGYLYSGCRDALCFVPDAPYSSASDVLKKASTDQHVYEGLCKRIAWDVLRELQNSQPYVSQPNVSQDGELLKRVLTIENWIGQNYRSEFQELFNNIGNLSLKLNTMQSDLREFEKQKVDPLARRVDMCENSDIQECKMVRKFINELKERIEALELHYRLSDMSNAYRKEECQHEWKMFSPIAMQCHKCRQIKIDNAKGTP